MKGNVMIYISIYIYVDYISNIEFVKGKKEYIFHKNQIYQGYQNVISRNIFHLYDTSCSMK